MHCTLAFKLGWKLQTEIKVSQSLAYHKIHDKKEIQKEHLTKPWLLTLAEFQSSPMQYDSLILFMTLFIIFEANCTSSKRIPTQHKDAHLIT